MKQWIDERFLQPLVLWAVRFIVKHGNRDQLLWLREWDRKRRGDVPSWIKTAPVDPSLNTYEIHPMRMPAPTQTTPIVEGVWDNGVPLVMGVDYTLNIENGDCDFTLLYNPRTEPPPSLRGARVRVLA